MLKTVLFFAIFASFLWADSDLDQQIENLQKEINSLRLKAMGKELNSERFYHSDWKAYTQDIEQNEKLEDEVQRKETELQALIKKREELNASQPQ